MREPIVFGSSQGNLGDNIFLTPILKAIKGCTIRMYDDASSHNISPIFDGLANVEFVEAPGVPPTNDEKIHKSQRMLNALGITEVNCIPEIIVKPEEEQWAREFLSQFGDINKLIVFVNNNSGWKHPDNWFARYLKPPNEIMRALLDIYSSKYTVLQFGKATPFSPELDNFDPLPKCYLVRGLDIRQTAACYKVIGRMITGDTGDPCLMLAVGGRFSMLVPPETNYYHYYDIRYYSELWKGEPIRARYREFSDWRNVVGDIDFNW